MQAWRCVAAMRASHDARLLFLISGDYGELSNALYFIRGQSFVSRTTLLLPPAVYAVNQGALPGTIREYASVQDVIDAVNAFEPDVVFLFSGYLYSTSTAFSLESCETLIRFLQSRGCRIVTSDPFIGALSTPETAADLARIHRPFLRVFELLKETVHYYPVPCDHLPGRITQVSVFNPFFLRMAGEGPHEMTGRFLREHNGDPAKAVWLFILSNEDYRVQVAKHGAAALAGHIIRMLKGTLAHGRQPVFIGPPACIGSIRARVPVTAGMILQSFCAHELFTSLVLDAEHVFYWNMFSNSIVLRLGNGLTTFFFDVGHLDRLYTLAVENYFLGWRPVCLDQRQALSEPVLRLMDAVFRRNIVKARDHFRRASSPEQAVATLIGESDE